ncbi:PleD family two-component system response regulator [Elusimicrobiota bacterium]
MNKRKKKILIIDDSPTVAITLQMHLEDDGYKIIKASDGLTGLKKIRATMPDLVISDLMLPGIDGYEVCKRTKDDPATCSIPFIFLTGKEYCAHSHNGTKRAEYYITKPYDIDSLLKKIHEITE